MTLAYNRNGDLLGHYTPRRGRVEVVLFHGRECIKPKRRAVESVKEARKVLRAAGAVGWEVNGG